MSDDLKERVLEIVSIAKECPEHLQPLCFELLLRDYLKIRQTQQPPERDRSDREQLKRDDAEPIPQDEQPTLEQQDLKAGDLHMKARKFLQKYSLSMDVLNELFYKEGEEIKPLYEDLKTTRMAEGQIRITLLQTLMAGMKTGEFIADGEAVRTESQVRKCYDKTNFAKNFKNSANLFDGFESYEKTTPLRLSEDGRKELAELIKELAQ